MVSGLCLRTKALRVTLLAEFAAEQSHEIGHSESQNCGCLRLCHKQKLAKSYHHPCNSGKTGYVLVLQMLSFTVQRITSPPSAPMKANTEGCNRRGQNAGMHSVLELCNRQSNFKVISSKVFNCHRQPCQNSQIKIFITLFTVMLPLSQVGREIFMPLYVPISQHNYIGAYLILV